MKREICSVAVLVMWIAGQAFAWDTSRNPDRWTEVGMQVTGGGDIGGDQQIMTSKGATFDPSLSGTNISVMGEMLMPLSNNWSVRVALGGSFINALRDQAATIDASDSHSQTLNYNAMARYYFVDHHLTSNDVSQNPDEWPSMGLTFTGSNRVGYSSVSTLNGVDNETLDNALDSGFSNSYGVSSDMRLPVSNHWTLTTSLGGNFNDFGNPGARNIAESETHIQTLNASAGTKYYFVGHNLIAQDNGKNPDRWISLATGVNGGLSVHGEQDNNLNGVETDRDTNTHNVGFSSELRLPVANALTLRLALSGSWAYSNYPLTGIYNENDSYTQNLTGLVGFRYFFE